MTPIELLIAFVSISLASARLAVLVSSDTILEAPRDWIYRHWPPFDNSAMGYDYQMHDKDGVPLPMGARREGHMTTELLTCTRCLTVWLTLITTAIWASGDVGVLVVEVIAMMFVAAWAAQQI